jgi:hypothetical protein
MERATKAAKGTTPAISREPIMPRGKSRWGFFTSSAMEDTMSKPRKEKNTVPAPLNTLAPP